MGRLFQFTDSADNAGFTDMCWFGINVEFAEMLHVVVGGITDQFTGHFGS